MLVGHSEVLSPTLPHEFDWVSISAGEWNAIALDSDGEVYTWGYHADADCFGDEILLADCDGCTFESVSAGENFYVGVLNSEGHEGDLFVWGGIYCFDPISLTDDGYIDSGDSPFTAVSAGGHHILALGDGILAVSNPIGFPGSCQRCCTSKYVFNAGEYPPPVAHDWWGSVPTNSIELFSAGHAHSLIWTTLDDDGVLFGWGNNWHAQTGIITTDAMVDPQTSCSAWVQNITIPNNVEPFIAPPNDFGPYLFVAIEGGDGHSTALLDDGTLMAWGDNSTANQQPCNVPGGTFLAFSSRMFHGAGISTCYADCDADGEVTSADLDCYDEYFNDNNIAADTDGDGVVEDPADRNLFLALMTAGCP